MSRSDNRPFGSKENFARLDAVTGVSRPRDNVAKKQKLPRNEVRVPWEHWPTASADDKNKSTKSKGAIEITDNGFGVENPTSIKENEPVHRLTSADP